MKSSNFMCDGSKYTGQFLKRTTIKDGIGQIIYKDGSLFEGIFRLNDTFKGRYITTNGYIYEGEMKCHKMHGKGTLKHNNKTIYKGKFKNGDQVDEYLDLTTTPTDFSIVDIQSERLTASKSVQFVFD